MFMNSTFVKVNLTDNFIFTCFKNLQKINLLKRTENSKKILIRTYCKESNSYPLFKPFHRIKLLKHLSKIIPNFFLFMKKAIRLKIVKKIESKGYNLKDYKHILISY